MLERYRHSLTYAESTVELYSLQVRLFLDWCEVTSRDPLSAEELDFIRYYEFRMTNGLSRRSLDTTISALKSFYRWLHLTGSIASMPHLGRAAPQLPNALPGTLSIEQMRAMWASAANDQQRLLVGLVGIYGLTADEALAIDVPDCRIDQHEATIRVDVQRRKGRSASLPIEGELRDVLVRCVADRSRGPLFAKPDGQRVSRRAALSWVKAIGNRAGIDPPPTLRDLSFTLRALAIAHGFSYVGTVRAIGEMSPTRSRRWWEQAPVGREHHGGLRLSHLLFADPSTAAGAIEEAYRSHYESHLPDAFAVMAAASALERHLRELAAAHGVEPKTPIERMALMPWADLLRGRGLLTPHDQAAVRAIADHRSWAAHGWYEQITPELAKRVLDECRRLVASLALPPSSDVRN